MRKGNPKMEVRLSEFAEIVGSTPAAIRSAIAKPDDLPFDDREFRVTKDAGQMTRRRYSVSDAFAWFLADEVPLAMGINARRMSALVRRSWGVPGYVEDRLAANQDVGDRFLIIWSQPDKPQRFGGFLVPSYSFGAAVGGVSQVDEYRRDRSVVLSINLDAMFRHFLAVSGERGWVINSEGFLKIDDAVESHQ